MSAPIIPQKKQKKAASGKPRISKTRELQKVFRYGKAVHAASLVLKFVKIPNLKASRLAFVVSKKVSKKAVVRNRIRRVLREELRTKLLSKMPVADYVIIVKSAAATYEAVDLRREIGLAAGKVHPF